MRVLVLGSEGFIGQRVRAWLVRNHDVRTADISGSASDSHKLITPDQRDFRPLLNEDRIDVCINCCGAANVQMSLEEPDIDYRLNAQLVHDILESIRIISPDTRFINLSSAAVYGNPVFNPIREGDATAPISPYGWHKLNAENICREYHQCFGIGTLSLRLFSVFGPGLRKQLYWDIFRRTRNVDRLICPGTGAETRDYIFVEDVARAIESCIEHAAFDGQPINVASGQSVEVREAIRALLVSVEWDGELIFDGHVRGGDPLHWRADISKLTALGYHPAYAYQDGIATLAAWLKSLPTI